jgi:hypothetical protein
MVSPSKLSTTLPGIEQAVCSADKQPKRSQELLKEIFGDKWGESSSMKIVLKNSGTLGSCKNASIGSCGETHRISEQGSSFSIDTQNFKEKSSNFFKSYSNGHSSALNHCNQPLSSLCYDHRTTVLIQGCQILSTPPVCIPVWFTR